MGAWGTGILDNDDALDIYSPYVRNIENEIPLREIKNDLRKQLYVGSEPMLIDNTAAWLGYAKAQLDTDTVDKEVVEVIGKIVADKIDADHWDDDKLLKARFKAIEELYISLKSKV